ncbi:MAG: non-heme iron oxygenase ferredoxin subunit [Steroidobacteraceae bacterium]
MSRWIDAGPVAAIAAGGWLTAEVSGFPVAIVRVGGELHAFEDRCTHDGESLAGAEIEENQVVCPRHGAHFCLRSGAALTPPAYEPLRIFAVRETDGRILVAEEP